MPGAELFAMKYLMFSFPLPACRLLVAVAILLLGCMALAAYANDDIFPPAPAAKAFIDFDGRGFLIHGKRTFLVSGSLHYSRVPRALWRDRLLRLKRAGFNTVQTYAFWNFHEPQEGKWDFSGEKDLDAFLKLVKEMGLYAVVRPGPYVCAEWDSGGYPVWLRFKPGLRVREDNPEFLAAVDHWYEKVIPIIAANQIGRGGAVILVQLENEDPQGWGTDIPNPYFRHLRDKAVALGLEVPFFFSGLHHGADPAGDHPWDSRGRTNPWYCTEFWPGWYDLYGPLDPPRARAVERGMWKILAYGGNGFNFYMLHGGTNFDTWNDNEVASCYDYGAAIGQAGDLRPIYYRFKRAALFARSFADILEDSVNATDAYQGYATDSALRITARKSPAGDILFLDNNGPAPAQSQVRYEHSFTPTAGPMTLEPGEILPIVQNFPLLPKVTLKLAAARLLGVVDQGEATTLLAYGLPGDPIELRFAVPAKGVTIWQGAPALALDPAHPTQLTLAARIPSDRVDSYLFTVGGKKVRVLVMDAATADHTWVVEAGESRYVVCNAPYVGEVRLSESRIVTDHTDHTDTAPSVQRRQADSKVLSVSSVSSSASVIQIFIERPETGNPFGSPPAPLLYGSGDQPQRLQAMPETAARPPAFTPVLSAWDTRAADAEAQPEVSLDGWKRSETPLPMGADGDISAYAWYRATVHVAQEGIYPLNLEDAGDRVVVFTNGKWADNSAVHVRYDQPAPHILHVHLKAGDNTLAVLAAHYGRNKLFNVLGPIDKIDAKGLAGPVSISLPSGERVPVHGWAMRGGLSDPEDPKALWKPFHRSVMNGIPTFYRSEFTAAPPAATGPHPILRVSLAGLSRGFVWLNGHNLGRYPEKVPVNGLYLPECWLVNGENRLVIFDEEGDPPTHVALVEETAASRAVTELAP
ncbi:MAG TPA: beta-galactosidase [Chthonomonadaceae bacterium]|nr:beta-galactosidase [Chthonomonadaceae bacterium]